MVFKIVFYYFASMWDECNCAELEHSLALPFFGIGMKTDLFQSCGNCWVFQICWHIECSTFTASSFRIWNSSTGIPSPPLTLFVVMLSKTQLTSYSRISGCNQGLFQRIARRDKKAFLSDQCQEIEENNRMGKTRDLFKKIRYQGNISCKDGLDKGQKWYGPNRSRRY